MSDYEKYPELFEEDHQLDPQTRKRSVPMKVMNLSMVQTGTTSLQRALEILGIKPVAHGFAIFTQSRDLNMWQEGMQAKWWPSPDNPPFRREEFDNLLGQYEGLSDWPCIAFSEELIKAYPEAKVILVEREIESWHKSFQKTVASNVFWPLFHGIAMLDYDYLGQFQIMTRLMVRGWFEAENQQKLEESARRTYRDHYDNLEDGWEPLCEFLDVEVPDVPFPRINDADELRKRINIVAWM
ncbi:hypothetical protein BDZ45DRAFT_717583 [Acephala macrosclerotiorum]|nr:hypothetical protein BDZ45DRAFT_717583 [Acephala macrosclerotiorum]